MTPSMVWYRDLMSWTTSKILAATTGQSCVLHSQLEMCEPDETAALVWVHLPGDELHGVPAAAAIIRGRLHKSVAYVFDEHKKLERALSCQCLLWIIRSGG